MVWGVNWLMRRYPIEPGIIAYLTVGTSIWARTIVTSKTIVSPRRMVTATEVSGAPRRRFTMSSLERSAVSTPSTLMIMSPAETPAR